MAINNITQTISTIPEAAHRGVDVQTQFVIKQEDFQDHLQGTTVTELNTLKDQLNSRIGEINSTATTMNGYADTASTGASTATTKAGEASTSAGEALSYKNQAETFKNNASASATKASQWADNNYNVEVETGKYSAKHWSTVAQNTVSNKIDKVISTDNAVVRFNGITGEVQNSSIGVDDNGNIGSGTQSFNGFGGSGFKNYIINGDMRIAQRGSGPFTTNGYGLDQWFSYISGTSSVIRCWEGTGSNHLSYAQVTVGSGADTVTMEHRLESPHRFSGKTLTLSYKLFNGNYSGSGVTYKIALNHAGGRTLLFSGTSVFAGGDKKKVTFTVPDLSGYTLNTNSYLEIRPVEIIGNGYSGVFGIIDIQLEEGSVATPFEHRPIGLELSLCQRYYEVVDGNVGGYGTAGQQIFATKPFTQSKRVLPSMGLLTLNGNNVNLVAPNPFATILNYAVFGIYIVGTGQGNFSYEAYASAEL